MKSVFACILCSLLSSASLPAVDTLRIMPLGNSITESRNGHASYRCWLWKTLTDSGYTVNFVGSRTGVYNGTPDKQTPSTCPYATFDEEHDGHWGWRADELLHGSSRYPGRIGIWARAAKPSIVLMHIGTNDIFQSQNDDSTRAEIRAIIDTLRTVNAQVGIIVAKLIPCTSSTNNTKISAFNTTLQALANAKNTVMSRVILVDQNTGFNATDDTFDGVHPNESGEMKMAALWFAAIKSLITTPPVEAKRAPFTSVKTTEPIIVFNAGTIRILSDRNLCVSVVDICGRSLLAQRTHAKTISVIPLAKLVKGVYCMQMIDDNSNLSTKKFSVTSR